MRTAGSRPRLIVFSGMDGTGKSTHARALVDELRLRGIRTVYRRLRFPFVSSVLLLLYARLRRWSYEIRASNSTIRVHDFAQSPLLRTLYPLTAHLDLLLATWFLIRLPMALGWMVVCDRFVTDSLIDVASSCGRDIVPGSVLARLNQALLPRGTMTFLLTASVETVAERRAESSFDPTFLWRWEQYQRAAAENSVLVVDSEDGFEVVHGRILAPLIEVGRRRESTTPRRPLSVRWYASVRTASLPDGAKAALLLLTHWLFQSMGIMGRVERAIKVSIGVLAFVPIFVGLVGLLGVGFAAILAGILAHSANFVLNAHIPVVLKHVNLEVGEERIHRYAEELRRRMQGRRSLEGVVIVGSLARDELGSGSDLDVRLLAQPGLWNALQVGILATGERARALVRRFPLDIYVADGLEALGALRESKNPVILCDNSGSFTTSLSQLRAHEARE